MTHTDVFLRMVAAYKLEIGAVFPSAGPESVLMVLRECNKPGPTSQKQIEQATRFPQPSVSKLMAKMIDSEWLDRSKRDPSTSVKKVQITALGAGVLLRLERSCGKAATDIPEMITPNTTVGH